MPWPPGWSGRVGELRPDVLEALLPAPSPEALYCVCGPPAMMDGVEGWLLGKGVSPRAIVSERFRYQ